MDDYRISDFIYMDWLRPENIVWEAVMTHLVGQELSTASNILEVGIGNGYNSFMTLGGKFSKEYDWYYNVNTEGFWLNKDIYDYSCITDLSKYIINKPTRRLKYALDHKQNLLNQANQLDFVNKLILQDANEYIRLEGISTIYSNILYWLRDPISALQNYEELLDKPGKIILVFPNTDFIKHCRSYKRENRLFTLLNRGRADSMLWMMDFDEFEKLVKLKTNLQILKFRRYLAPITLKISDIGLRPLSPVLIKMANSLNESTRLEIKEEWCETLFPFVEELLALELENGHNQGGYNFVVLGK